jgi:hypothetical protein
MTKFPDEVVRIRKSRANDRCECRRTNCGHHGPCQNLLTDEDQRPRQRAADLDDFTVANCQIFCSRCEGNPVLAISA